MELILVGGRLVQGAAVEADGFKGRKAPYAPVSALDEFFDKMRNVSVPARVDQRFLQKLSIAAGNEWALLSALKFLDIVDQQGKPTHSYRLLQSSEKFKDTLRHLVLTAYAPVFEAGGLDMPADDLANYFRVTSSPSQHKNAARFFRAVCQRAGIEGGAAARPAIVDSEEVEVPMRVGRPVSNSVSTPTASPAVAASTRDLVLRAKVALLEKLPPPREEWTAAEYEAICTRFLEMLRHLDA